MDIEILTNFTQILIDSLRKVQTDDIPEEFISVLDELIRIAKYISMEVKSRRQRFDANDNTVCVPDENKDVTLLEDVSVTEDETYPSNTSTMSLQCMDYIRSNAGSELCGKTDCTKTKVAVVKMREGFCTKRCTVALNRVNIHSSVLNIHELQHTSRLTDVRKTVMSTNDGQGSSSEQVVEKANQYIRVNHEGKRFKCNHKKCDRMFRSKKGLQYHTLMHECKNPEICQVCSRAFKDRSNLLRHMRIHNGEKPYQCEVCDLTFARLHTMKEHLRIHSGEKPFVCNVCHTAFRSASTLLVHNKLHTRDKLWKCAHCRMSYIRKSSLRSHLLKCFPNHHFQDRFEDNPQKTCN